MAALNNLIYINKLTVTGESEGPHLLITAGVHGDEFEPMEAARRVFKEVQSMQPQLKGTLTVVPVVNQPAFRLGCRTGEDHLDLARVCPGNKEGSRTEQIAFEISALIRNSDFYIDMHSGGRLFYILPFAGYILHANVDILNAQREIARSFLLPIVWGTEPNLSGRTLSVARDENIPAIYTEIGGGGPYREDHTTMAVEGCINVMKHLKMIPAKPKPSKIRFHLEDYRPGSGHLQHYLPAPCSGFYLPKVINGQTIEKGEELGCIQDNLGKRLVDIKADHSGTVINLRNILSVKKGDSLGIVLPAIEQDTIQTINQ